MDAILVPGGFGKRGIEGKITAIRYARENKVPYLGICLGMQLAVIEYARNVVGLDDAHSTEFDPDTPHPVIALITEWQDRDGRVEQRDAEFRSRRHHAAGRAGMRARAGTRCARFTAANASIERHRHRYEVNNHYLPRIEAAGMRVSGVSAKDKLCEMIELPRSTHPWFVGCQFHPEFTSTPRTGHPLFNAFVRAALRNAKSAGSPLQAAPKLQSIA